MKNQRHVAAHHHERLTEYAEALVAATRNIADEKVAQARHELEELVATAKEGYDYAWEKTAEGAKGVDTFVQGHPYKAAGLALGLGTLMGFFLRAGSEG